MMGFLFMLAFQEKVIVFFRDKGEIKNPSLIYERIEHTLSPRAIERRKRIRKGKPIIDERDLPICEEYVKTLERMGFKVHHRLKWVNAVSGWIEREKIREIGNLPFVKEVRGVRKFKRRVAPPVKREFDYGDAENQIKLLNVHKLHNMGIYGEGVIIGVFDTGFRIHEYDPDSSYMGVHPALDHVKVLAEHDFINNDDFTDYDPTQDWREDPDYIYGDPWSFQPGHGTAILSLLAGFQERSFVGVAFGATYVLAKTEIVCNLEGERVEISAEEDNWCRAVEWAESLGVDIISSSLGYRMFEDDTVRGYTYADLDGNTALITRYADMAVNSYGILVFNAMGNVEGSDRPDTCIVAPADGDSVVAVGGVYYYADSLGNFEIEWAWDQSTCYGSAIGPTVDGRIKPDLVGPWYAVVVNPGYTEVVDEMYGGNVLRYIIASGTSAATALVAGVAALLLQAHPSWRGDPGKVISILKATASNAGSPDDTLGWGVPDAYAACLWEPIELDTSFLDPLTGEEIPFDTFTVDRIGLPYPNPFRPGGGRIVKIPIRLTRDTFVRFFVYTPSGKRIYEENVGRSGAPGTYVIEWDGRDGNGNYVSSGIYLGVVETGFGKFLRRIAVIR